MINLLTLIRGLRKGNKTVDKWSNMLKGVDVATSVGLEFGPLMSPMVTKQMGEVHYIDHTDTAGLRQKYGNDANVDISRIVDVDFVIDGRPLAQIVNGRRFDYVIASHVFEHIPNPIGWLVDCSSVLTPEGVLSLAIPDKRYTFDHFRAATTIDQWIDAWLRNDQRPSPRSVFDAASLCPGFDSSDLWNRRPEPPPRSQGHLAWALKRARDAQVEYVDAHVTVCTCDSLLVLLRDAALLDLHPFVLKSFFPTERGSIEFQMQLALPSHETSAEARAASFQSEGA